MAALFHKSVLFHKAVYSTRLFYSIRLLYSTRQYYFTKLLESVGKGKAGLGEQQPCSHFESCPFCAFLNEATKYQLFLVYMDVKAFCDVCGEPVGESTEEFVPRVPP